MLKNYTQVVSMTANITVADSDGKDATVEYISASVQEDGAYSINQSVQDRDLYFAHEEEVKADEEKFKKRVDNVARGDVPEAE